ncbi:uncharacterized protein DNG_08438 [Cephalotrichum gorgonifer]|uniref:Myb-like domain-containing protein n=1 Tax=Cephalotrichum gorgonifer TaxID=2041049 RepID=A0AAE8N3I7_9PEZI|nr:uncharacterized protein DNG_08438 [Cephalotrichum gorgonifer]
MNKSWDDRADKDLFFTILSVKAIGIISGAEWTTIGNHMRSVGYGFTNEGCRQHFQGLRRSQLKKVSSAGAAPGASSEAVDPSLNPITRRPGPGRGRPRKSASNPALATAAPKDQPEDKKELLQNPQPLQLPDQLEDQKPVLTQQDEPQHQIPHAPVHEPILAQTQHVAEPAMTPVASAPSVAPATMSIPLPLTVEEQGADTLDLQSGSDEPDEHVAKRPRLEEEQTHETLDDDAVLALTGHENPPDSYPSPTFNYAEA